MLGFFGSFRCHSGTGIMSGRFFFFFFFKEKKNCLHQVLVIACRNLVP